MSHRIARLVGLVLVGCLVLELRAEPEVTADGKKLSEWLVLIRGKDDAPRRQAVAALAAAANRTPRAVAEAVVALLDADDPRQALDRLGELGPAAVPALTRALFDDDAKRRLIAVLALDRLGGAARPASAALVRLLTDPEPTVRATAALALGKIDRRAVPALVAALRDEGPSVRVAAAHSLAQLGYASDRLVPVLLDWLKDDKGVGRIDTLAVLFRLGPEAGPATPALVRLLDAPEEALRRGALRTLAGMGPAAREAAPALKAILADRERTGEHSLAAEALWLVAQAPEALQAWKRVAADPGHPERTAAAVQLWTFGRDPAALAALVGVVASDRPDRSAAVEAVRDVGPPAAEAALEPLRKRLKEAKAGERFPLVQALGRLGEAARPALADLLPLAETKDPVERFVARQALARIRPDDASFKLVADLLADAPEVRSPVARFLAEAGPKAAAAAPALRKAMEDPEPLVRLDAAVALWRIARDEKALPVALAVLDDPTPATRFTAALEIGHRFASEGKAAVPALRALLWDDAQDVRTEAASALGRIGPAAKDAVPALVALLADDDREELHSAASEALGLIGPAAREAVPTLKRRLEHGDAYVRACAGLALWHIAEDAAGEKALAAVLDDRNYRARITAAEALARMGNHPRAVPVLLQALQPAGFHDGGQGANREYMAARALGRLGTKAKAALPALRALLDREDVDLRDEAATAVRRIEGTTTPPSPGRP